jgi:hypothetical protein
MPGRLSQYYKGAAQIGGNHLVKHLYIAIGDWRKRHDPRTVHYHVNLAEHV